MTRFVMLVMLAGLGFVSQVRAAPAPAPGEKKKDGPAIVLQAQSLDQLLKTLREGVGRFVPPETMKQFEAEVLGAVTPDHLKGLDFKRPFAAYANLDPSIFMGDFEKSTLVALVPVSAEKDFIDLITTEQIQPKKLDDGRYEINLPGAPVPISIRFLNRYAYIGIAGKDFDVKLLLPPTALIDEKETAALALRITPGQFAPGFKQATLDAFKGFMEKMQPPAGAQVPAILPKMQEYQSQMISYYLHMFLDETEQITIRIYNDPKDPLQVFEVVVDPKAKTDFARSVTSYKPRLNQFGGLLKGENVAHLVITSNTFDAHAKQQELQMLGLLEGLLPDAEPMAQGVLTELVKVGKRTIEKGNLDFALILRGPNKEGQYTALAALGADEPGDLEKALKTFIAGLPGEAQQLFKFDVEKVGGLSVHEIIPPADGAPEEITKLFGKELKLRYAFGKTGVFAAFGPDSLALIKEASTVKPGKAPLVELAVDRTRTTKILQGIAPELFAESNWAGALLKGLGPADKVVLLKQEQEGGSKLTARMSIPGMAIFAGIYGARGGPAK